MFILSWIFLPQEIWAIFLFFCCYWYQCLWNCGWLDYFWIWHVATVFPVNVLLSFQCYLLQRSWVFLDGFWFSKGLLLWLYKTSLSSRKCSAFLSIAEILIAKAAVTSYIRGIVIYLMVAPQDFPLPSCSGFFHVPPQDSASLPDHTCFQMHQKSDEDYNLLPFQMRMVAKIFFCEALLSCVTLSSTFIILSLCLVVKLLPTSESFHMSLAKFSTPLEGMVHQNQVGHKLNTRRTIFLFLSLVYFWWKPWNEVYYFQFFKIQSGVDHLIILRNIAI